MLYFIAQTKYISIQNKMYFNTKNGYNQIIILYVIYSKTRNKHKDIYRNN